MTDTKQYEIMVILKPDLTQKKSSDALAKIREHIASFKGEIQHEDLWGKREFAYTMKKYDEGYYAIFYATLDGAHLVEFKHELELDPAVLRSMIVTFPVNLSIKDYLEKEGEITKKLEEEEEERRKVREEREKKNAAKRKSVTAKKDEKKKDADESTEEDKEQMKEELDEMLGEVK